MLAYITQEQVGDSNQETGKENQPLDPFAATNIHLVNIATGEEWQLRNDSSIGNIDPTWSPNGSQVAFVSKRNGTCAIYLVTIDGSNLRELPTTYQWVRFPSWVKQQALTKPE